MNIDEAIVAMDNGKEVTHECLRNTVTKSLRYVNGAFIVLRTIKLTLAAWLNGEEVEVSFLANLFKLVVDGLLIWWLVESFKS